MLKKAQEKVEALEANQSPPAPSLPQAPVRPVPTECEFPDQSDPAAREALLKAHFAEEAKLMTVFYAADAAYAAAMAKISFDDLLTRATRATRAATFTTTEWATSTTQS